MGSSITYWLFNELKYSLRLIFKIPNVHFFSLLGKRGKSSKSNIQKLHLQSLCDLEVQPKINIHKSQL